MDIRQIEYFNELFIKELRLTKVSIPTACCLSTIGTDGFPNARFVSLKEIVDGEFVITGNMSSRKGIEISKINKVALTFWWTETGQQVRIQGNARRISEKLSDSYFAARNRESQIVSIVSEQGKEITTLDELNKKYQVLQQEYFGKSIERPNDFGGFAIKPQRIEFLEFKTTRFHERKLYELIDGKWNIIYLQP